MSAGLPRALQRHRLCRRRFPLGMAEDWIFAQRNSGRMKNSVIKTEGRKDLGRDAGRVPRPVQRCCDLMDRNVARVQQPGADAGADRTTTRIPLPTTHRIFPEQLRRTAAPRGTFACSAAPRGPHVPRFHADRAPASHRNRAGFIAGSPPIRCSMCSSSTYGAL